MADEFRFSFPASFFIGDQNAIVEAGDIAAVHDSISGRASIKFIDGANESAAVSQSFSCPSDAWTDGSGVEVRIHYFGDAAGGGAGVKWDVAFEAISESDAHDMHATADAFDGEQTVTDVVDAAAGELNIAIVNFTQAEADAITNGDAVRMVLRRDSADGVEDDYADSVWVTHVDLYEVVA